jgi:translocation and assembly module TamB
VDAEGPLRALPSRFQAEGQAGDPFSFAGKGVVRAQGQELAADLEGAGRINKAAFSLVGPAALRLGPVQSSLSLSAAAAGGTVRADLRRSGEEVTGEIRAQAIDVAELAGDFVGKVSGELDLSGRGPHLSGRLASRIAGLRSRDEPESEGLSGTVTAALENGRLRLKADAVNVAGLKSHGEADLPAEASAVPFRIAVDRTKPLTGGFSVEGEVRPLWDVLAGGERSLAGRINASGVVAGSMNRLLLTGTASLSQGRFQDIASGLQLQGLGVEAVFGQDALVVNRFSAADGRGGSISGDGRVSFEEGGASTFRLTLKKFQLLDNDTGRATASGSVLVAHPAKGEGKISGELIVDRADIVAAAPTPTGVVPMDVVEIHQKQQHGPEPAAAARAGPPIGLDVAVRAARGVYLKGRGLNLELSLESRVTGSVDHPAFEGVARVVAGNYDFAGKRFDVESSGTIHLGATAAQIRLDLSATWSDPTITAVVKVQGTAAKPEITLTSSPVLPQDEILARVLFGVSASQLAPAQGAEMASALASLAGGGGFDVIGNLRQFAGLDRLALGATQTAQTTISGGKYISKDVYLELTGGARNGTGASVEWRIQKNLSLISRYGAALDPRYPNDSDASLSIRFRRDF